MSRETVTSTKGIFSFDEHTYVWAWFLVAGEERDFLGCLYRQNADAELTFTYRFRYYESDDPFDKRDVKHVYHAMWPATHDVNAALVLVRRLAAEVAREYGSELDELSVNGDVDTAANVLLKHRSAHVATNGPGGDA